MIYKSHMTYKTYSFISKFAKNKFQSYNNSIMEIMRLHEVAQQMNVSINIFRILFYKDIIPAEYYNKIPSHQVPEEKLNKNHAPKYEWDIQGILSWYVKYKSEHHIRSGKLSPVYIGRISLPENIHQQLMDEFKKSGFKKLSELFAHKIIPQRYI